MKFVTYLHENRRYVSPKLLLPQKQLAQQESGPTAISKLPDFQQPPKNEYFLYSKALHQFLQGKKLLPQELPFPIKLIDDHYQNGYIAYQKGLIAKRDTYSCNRCGNDAKHLFAAHQCSRCDEEECVYCRNCIAMGKVGQCTPLLTWTGQHSQYAPRGRVLEWRGWLSKGQQTASERIVAAVGQSEKILIWAVCGAGKTEILFEGINTAIETGQNILIATPRRDVVAELTPRIKKVFPDVEVLSLYGGSEDRGKSGQLIIATTHQLLRYENYFDFVVIDEVDAFPLSYDPMLKHAINQAAKNDATSILLTATPDKQMQKQVQKGILTAVKIPKRYHGLPLPVPKLKWLGNWQKQLKKFHIPRLLTGWLSERIAAQQQVFLFVPSVVVLKKIVPLLQTQFQALDGVHSEDPERHEKVQKFRDAEIQLLVTTTILERGVTIANVAVAIYGADDEIFTESALVQISGRVGRSREFPSGEIIFFHYGKTEMMLDAIDHINEMNKLGGESTIPSK